MTCACAPRPLTAVFIAVANLAAPEKREARKFVVYGLRFFLAADAKTFTDTENVKLTEKKIKPWPKRELQKLFHCL